MKHFFLLLSFLFCAQIAISQKVTRKEIDSLNALASEVMSNNDHDRISKLLSSSILKSEEVNYQYGQARSLALSGIHLLNQSNLDSAEALLKQADLIYQKNKVFGDSLESKYGTVLFGLGRFYVGKRAYAMGEEYLRQTLPLFKREPSNENYLSALNALGRSKGRQTDYATALSYFLQVLDQNPDPRTRSIAMGNISICYRRTGQIEKSIDYLKEGLALDVENEDEIPQINKYNTLGTIYSDLDKMDSSIYFTNKAYELGKKWNRLNSVVIAVSNLAQRYVIQEQFNLAIKLMEEALELADSVGIPGMEEKFDMVKAGIAFSKERDYNQSIFYAKRALISTEKFSNKRFSSHLARLISESYEKKSRPDSALHYLKTHYEIEKEIFNKGNQAEFTKLYAKLDNIEKQKEIELLEKQRAVDEAKKDSLTILIISILALSAAVVLILLLRQRNNQKKQQIKELELENQIEKRELQMQQQTLHMINLNNNIVDVEENLKKIKKQDSVSGKDVQKVLSNIMVNKTMDKEWQQFESYFTKIHPTFSQDMARQHEKLTQQERRLAALIKMDLSNREIASLLNIEQRSVIMNRYRLKRKLGLEESDDLGAYIHSF